MKTGKLEKRNLYIYIGYLGILTGVFLYMGYTGFRIINTDEVEHVDAKNTRGHRVSRFYHK